MQHFVRSYGANEVYEQGLSALGFPPTLVTHMGEAKKVLKALQNRETER
jgi:hypothetical protein